MTSFVSEAEVEGIPLCKMPARISLAVHREAAELCPACGEKETATEALIALANATGSKVVFVIDEWGALIREAAYDGEAQNRYLDLLRSWFKNNSFTPKVVAAAYMTGILPIKKNGSQSAISDFREYSVLDQGFATFLGFIEQEVRTEFDTVLRRARHPELVSLVRRSDELLEDTCLNELEFD